MTGYAFQDSAALRAKRRARELALMSFYQLSRESSAFLEIYVVERVAARAAELGSIAAAHEDLAAVFDLGVDVVRLGARHREAYRREVVELADGTTILRGRTVRPRLEEVVLDPEVRAHFRALEDRQRDTTHLFLEACRRRRPRAMLLDRFDRLPVAARTELRAVLDAHLAAADLAERAEQLFAAAGAIVEGMEIAA